MAMAGPAPKLLAYLRASKHVGVLVILVFFLKIGAAAACIQHEFVDLLGKTGGTTEVVLKAANTSANDESPAGGKSHLASCNHCGCHHASAVPPMASVASTLISRQPLTHRAGLPPSAMPRLELRPPIA